MASSDIEYSEKRNFIRMFVNANVKITDPKTGNSYEGRGQNLSGDGAMFISNQQFAEDQKLTIDISSEQSNLATLSAEFQVVRVVEIEDGQFSVAGTMLGVK